MHMSTGNGTQSSASWTPLLLVICLTTTLGNTVPLGYFLGVLNAPADLIKNWCQDLLANEYDTPLSGSQLDVLWACIVSIFLLGGICGSCFSAWCSDKYGRRGTLVISSILFILASILFLFCRDTRSLEMLLSARFLGGIASAFVLTVHPMYLLELAPIALAGTVGVFTCIGITGGILVAQIVTLPQLLGTEEFWHYALSFYALLVFVCLIPMWWFPESPRWLCVVRQETFAAEDALRRLRGEKGLWSVPREMHEMEVTEVRKGTWCSVLRDRNLWLPVLLVASYQASLQLCGINAIFYYSMSLFTDAGFSADMAVWLNLGLGGFNVLASLLCTLLVFHFPRRPLMLISCSGCALTLLAMSFGLYYMDTVQWLSYACIAFMLMFILAFQMGLGPITYFMGSELFEVSPRPVAMSIGSLFSWIGNFLIGMCFPLLQSVWSSFAFLPCMCVCIYCVLLTWRYLPETRGRTASDVKHLMNQGLRSRIN